MTDKPIIEDVLDLKYQLDKLRSGNLLKTGAAPIVLAIETKGRTYRCSKIEMRVILDHSYVEEVIFHGVADEE